MSTLTTGELAFEYDKLKKLAAAGILRSELAEHLARIAELSILYLTDLGYAVPLHSQVPNKEYFAFSLSEDGAKLSRAVNRELFDPESIAMLPYLVAGTLEEIEPSTRSRLLYTIASAFFATTDLLKKGDQKTPSVYFEILCGHLLGRAFGVSPRREVDVLHLEDERDSLPTDFIFDLGKDKRKFHIPVKASTRERAIQFFAHQRILDGVHGFGKFTGVLVAFAETKLDHNSREVVEICLPRQWRVYQRLLAPMHRFYYFDLPGVYAAMAAGPNPMPFRTFSQFYDEKVNLIVE